MGTHNDHDVDLRDPTLKSRIPSTAYDGCATMIVKVVLLFGLLVFAQADEGSRGDSERTTCGLYLAESSIKNAGWGVFAGKDFRLGDHMVGFD